MHMYKCTAPTLGLQPRARGCKAAPLDTRRTHNQVPGSSCCTRSPRSLPLGSSAPAQPPSWHSFEDGAAAGMRGNSPLLAAIPMPLPTPCLGGELSAALLLSPRDTSAVDTAAWSSRRTPRCRTTRDARDAPDGLPPLPSSWALPSSAPGLDAFHPASRTPTLALSPRERPSRTTRHAACKARATAPADRVTPPKSSPEAVTVAVAVARLALTAEAVAAGAVVVPGPRGRVAAPANGPCSLLRPFPVIMAPPSLLSLPPKPRLLPIPLPPPSPPPPPLPPPPPPPSCPISPPQSVDVTRCPALPPQLSAQSPYEAGAQPPMDGGESDSSASRSRRGASVSLQPRLKRLDDLDDLHKMHAQYACLYPRLDCLISPRWSTRQQHPPDHRPPPRPRYARSIELEKDALLRLRDEYQARILKSLLSSAVQEARLVPRPCVHEETTNKALNVLLL